MHVSILYVVLVMTLIVPLHVSPAALSVDWRGLYVSSMFPAGYAASKVVWSPDKPPMLTLIVPAAAVRPLLGARVDSLDAVVYDAVNNRFIRGLVHVDAGRMVVLGVNGTFEKRLPVSGVVGENTVLYVMLPLVPTTGNASLYSEAWLPYHAVNMVRDGVVLMVPSEAIVDAFKQYREKGRPVDLDYVASTGDYVFLLLYDKENGLGADNYFYRILFPGTGDNGGAAVLDTYSVVENTYIVNATGEPGITVLETIHHSSFIVTRSYTGILAYDAGPAEKLTGQWYYFGGNNASTANRPPRRTTWFYIPVDTNASNKPYTVFEAKPRWVNPGEETFTLALGSHVYYIEVATDIACFSYGSMRTHGIPLNLTILVTNANGALLGQSTEAFMIPPCMHRAALSYRALAPVSPEIDEPIKIHVTYTLPPVDEDIDEEILVRPSIIMARDMEAYVEDNGLQPLPNATIVHRAVGGIKKNAGEALSYDAVAVVDTGLVPTGIIATWGSAPSTFIQHYVSGTLLGEPGFTAHIKWEMHGRVEPGYIDIYLGDTVIKHIDLSTAGGSIDVEISYANISAVLEALTRNGEPETIIVASPLLRERDAYLYIGNITLRYVRAADIPGLDERYTGLSPPAAFMGFAEGYMYSGGENPEPMACAAIYCVGDHYTRFRVGDETYNAPLWLSIVYTGSAMGRRPGAPRITDAVAELRLPRSMGLAVYDATNYGNSVYVEGQLHRGWEGDAPKAWFLPRIIASLPLPLFFSGGDASMDKVPVSPFWFIELLRRVSSILEDSAASTHVELRVDDNYTVYRVSWSSGVQVAGYVRIKIRYMEVPSYSPATKTPRPHRVLVYYRLGVDTPLYTDIAVPLHVITGEYVSGTPGDCGEPPMYMEDTGFSPPPRVL